MFVSFCTNSHESGPHDIRSEAGYSLVELLVAILAASLVFAGVAGALESGQTVEARDTEWALTLQQARAGLARMAYEIRESRKVLKAEAGAITFVAPLGGKAWEVKYECSVAQTGTTYDQCARYAVEDATEETKTLPSSGATMVRDVLNGTAVFSYTPSSTAPTLATIKLELPAKGTLKQVGNSSAYSDHIVLEDAAFMRTLDPSG